MRGGRVRTDWIVFHHAHERRRSWSLEGVKETCHGHGDETDIDQSRLGYDVKNVDVSKILLIRRASCTQSMQRDRGAESKGLSYLSWPLLQMRGVIDV